jgi:hypothetical protein
MRCRYIVTLQRTLEVMVEVDASNEASAIAEAEAYMSDEWPSWMVRPAPRPSAPHRHNQIDSGWRALKVNEM